MGGFFDTVEYNKSMNNCCKKFPGVIRKMDESKCPHTCVIPLVTVQTVDGIKNLAACFVHVLSTNTTYYIDECSRAITVWAGPVEYDDYDYEANPLNLRSQEVWDFKNSRIIRYNKTGQYLIFTEA